jgi:hypothetical protein
MSAVSHCVGCRVIDSEGYKATVRYIGPVAGAKNKEEIWFGVEWDNATRGKHDGSSADSSGVLHKYFECAPGSGSFIKPTKVTYGRSFLEALNDRYVRLDAPTIAEANAVLPNAFVTTSKGNQKSIEFVGEEKIRYEWIYSLIICCCSEIALKLAAQKEATDRKRDRCDCSQ